VTTPGLDSAVASAFNQQRGRLMAVAYRMLGSRADAEDAVQEAWLRLARQETTTIDNLAGWLTTVVGRVCIDMLRSRTTRSERAYEEWLPELVVTDDDGGTPEAEALMAESVGLALLVVLDSLGPAERLAFVLHDMFAVPFDEIGQVLGKSAETAKVLASRARRKVQDAPRPSRQRSQQRSVVDAFLAAARDGDFEALLRVLDPELVWRDYTPRGVVVRLGATEVAERTKRGNRAKLDIHRVLVNGEPGILAWGPSGRPVTLIAFTVVDHSILAILSVTDPQRLAMIDLPERPI
jgi:RNA polymerase sigma factor (sigma-70 family)